MSTPKTFGTLDATIQKNVKISFTSQLNNGTSSVTYGGTIVVTIDCLWTDRDTYTPANQTSYGSPYANFLLVTAEQQMRETGLCRITLTYQSSYQGTPPTQYTEQNGTMEVSIVEHPDFDDWASDEQFDSDTGAFTGFIQSSDKYGIETYIVGTRIIIKKEYFTDKPSDESANIGKTQNPGLDYAGDGNYLVIGSQRAQEGVFWNRTTTYRYSANAWNSDIYKAA